MDPYKHEPNPTDGPEHSNPPVAPIDDDGDAFWSMIDSWVNDPVPLQEMPFVQSDDHHQSVGFDGGDLSTYTTRLDIHGNVGSIYHAFYFNDGVPLSGDHMGNNQFLDFSTRSFEDIREYLKGYIGNHRQNGYILLQEPISLFYEALSVGFDWINFGGKQRERVKNMTLQDFAIYFDRTINDASVELRLCATVIKKKLRSFEIDRWPYRKVKSLQGKLTNLIGRTGGEYNRLIKMGPERVETEIQKLQQRISDILSGRRKP
uniref:RWP-RK domain-containing protein n=1 Tax=Chenopodium quinoa TaxID=63459 RepID=A0A803LB58_CHEQI